MSGTVQLVSTCYAQLQQNCICTLLRYSTVACSSQEARNGVNLQPTRPLLAASSSPPDYEKQFWNPCSNHQISGLDSVSSRQINARSLLQPQGSSWDPGPAAKSVIPCLQAKLVIDWSGPGCRKGAFINCQISHEPASTSYCLFCSFVIAAGPARLCACFVFCSCAFAVSPRQTRHSTRELLSIDGSACDLNPESGLECWI